MGAASLRGLALLRAEEDAAHRENERRNVAQQEAERNCHIIEGQLAGAVDAANEFFEGSVTVEPSDLRPINRRYWRAAWEFTAEGLPFEVRLNNFYGLRLMNGENPTDDSGGPGRYLESLADVVTPTSSLARRSAAEKPQPTQAEKPLRLSRWSRLRRCWKRRRTSATPEHLGGER